MEQLGQQNLNYFQINFADWQLALSEVPYLCDIVLKPICTVDGMAMHGRLVMPLCLAGSYMLPQTSGHALRHVIRISLLSSG